MSRITINDLDQPQAETLSSSPILVTPFFFQEGQIASNFHMTDYQVRPVALTGALLSSFVSSPESNFPSNRAESDPSETGEISEPAL